MPELPEVETVCRGLQQTVAGKTIGSLVLRRPDMRIPFPPDLAKIAENGWILEVRRRAKYLLMMLDSGAVLIVHLGMSGRLVYRESMPATLEKHAHAVFSFTDGSALVFIDPRRFGLLTWTPAGMLETHPFFRSLGPDPFDSACTPAYLMEALKGRKTPLKQALMDQRLLVGVGNIYACEALYRARLSPRLPAGSLSSADAGRLLYAVREVLTEAIASGGSTLRDYVRSSGDAGYFQHHFAVYGRTGQPCSACRNPVRRAVQGGRSTFFCPACQGVRASENCQ